MATFPFCIVEWVNLQSEEDFQTTIDAAEAHECHSEETSCDKGDRYTPEGLGHIEEVELFTESCEEHHRKEKADACGEGIDDAWW